MTTTHETSSRMDRGWRGLPSMLPAGVVLCVVSAMAWVGLRGRPAQTTPAGLVHQVQQPVSATSEATSARTTSHQPPPFVLPTLLPPLLNPPALTVELETRRVGQAGGYGQRKTVTRTAERVHVSLGPNAVEWLFVRNPADRQRMSGTMLDHTRKSIVEYDESELRNGGLGRGWADVVSLGVEPETLRELVPTGKRQTLNGIEFEQRIPKEPQRRVRELWWSDSAALPLHVTNDGPAATEVVTRSVRRQVDESLLRDMRDRYPEYAVIDIADYREKHHDDSHHE